jgi:hypothetical protein
MIVVFLLLLPYTHPIWRLAVKQQVAQIPELWDRLLLTALAVEAQL